MNLNLSQNISSTFVINTSANFLETIFSFMLDIISYLMCIDPFSNSNESIYHAINCLKLCVATDFQNWGSF